MHVQLELQAAASFCLVCCEILATYGTENRSTHPATRIQYLNLLVLLWSSTPLWAMHTASEIRDSAKPHVVNPHWRILIISSNPLS